jgi:DNA-binding Xre family transcriptional regulator
MTIVEIMKTRKIKQKHLCEVTGLSPEQVENALNEDRDGLLADKKLVLLKGICTADFKRKAMLTLVAKNTNGLDPDTRKKVEELANENRR